MISDNPLVSIIMNCYNSDQYLSEAIESVLNQTYQHWEIIFWDNQSTDKSAKIITQYDDKRIKYFYAPTHTNLGEARNLALQKISGEFIAFLDCDDFWASEKLQKQIECFQKDPSVDLIYTNYWIYNEISKKCTIALKKNFLRGQGDKIFRKILLKYPIGMSTVLLKAEKLFAMPEWFDPSLQLTEEFDLFLRLLHQGKLEYINKTLVTYRIHSLNESTTKIQNWELEYNHILKKLEVSWPYFNIKYKKEIRYLKVLGKYILAKHFMKIKRYQDAIDELSSIRFNSFKFFGLFCIVIFKKYF